ncbi:MAG: 50S ribosomal protein L24e [Thermoprotei archaeon]|nr:MAG: 50S ribosomal protein L24e [Thermoprotei archaeon]RLE82018.1 MAG: 50S ribosomal protein L24e [Thermoprotei archaeon]RLF01906.1 MAG: 50S ribosomal protein L24e [Thermoprotei archaeon]
MPVVRQCHFCGHPIPPGTGLMYVKTDGTIYYFCSRKCRVFFFRGTDPRKLKWTRRYLKEARA